MPTMQGIVTNYAYGSQRTKFVLESYEAAVGEIKNDHQENKEIVEKEITSENKMNSFSAHRRTAGKSMANNFVRNRRKTKGHRKQPKQPPMDADRDTDVGWDVKSEISTLPRLSLHLSSPNSSPNIQSGGRRLPRSNDPKKNPSKSSYYNSVTTTNTEESTKVRRLLYRKKALDPTEQSIRSAAQTCRLLEAEVSAPEGRMFTVFL
ncbi:hypothetical protein BJ878DRAFT_493939 [Calycina marina]|uniref:Uncharacterized protein n=1 Tax=Calycina marina TaxID=1763456 RepID=A0A9P8CHP9_9HELO|nr:hypothetical protein BJ878DRAFT_493939 [Calycina marina]